MGKRCSHLGQSMRALVRVYGRPSHIYTAQPRGSITLKKRTRSEGRERVKPEAMDVGHRLRPAPLLPLTRGGQHGGSQTNSSNMQGSPRLPSSGSAGSWLRLLKRGTLSCPQSPNKSRISSHLLLQRTHMSSALTSSWFSRQHWRLRNAQGSSRKLGPCRRFLTPQAA